MVNRRVHQSSVVECAFALKVPRNPQYVTPSRGIHRHRNTSRGCASSSFNPSYMRLLQVQVRGVRVSLEVVEMVVCRAMKLPADAFAAVWDPGLPDVLHSEETSASNHGLETTSVSSHPDRGHLIGCFVQDELPDGYKSVSRLKQELARELSVAQCPTHVVLVEERLPLTVTGKVSCARLRGIVLVPLRNV